MRGPVRGPQRELKMSSSTSKELADSKIAIRNEDHYSYDMKALEPLECENEEVKQHDPELIYQQMDNEEIPEEPATLLL